MIDNEEEGTAGILNELPITRRASLILTDQQSSQESSYDDETDNVFGMEEEKELKIEVDKVTLTMNRAQTLDPTTNHKTALEEEKKVDDQQEEEVKSS